MGTEFNIDQFNAIYPPGIENHYWTLARNKILHHALTTDHTHLDILEVGCGKGIVVDYLLNKGLKIRGIELAGVHIDPKLQAFVKSGIDVFDVDMNEFKHVDTIMLLDVIEHIEFPEQFLLALKQKFPALKSFIITVPACQELFSNYDEFNGHFRRYDSAMLRQEFKNISYNKMKVGYFFHSLYLPAKALLNTKGKRAEEIIAPKGAFKKIIHSILATFFYLEYLLIPSKLKGTSLLLKIDLN
jgi:cyclopropane fatty-acyl-phospholipid synthase-like methyltransferase